MIANLAAVSINAATSVSTEWPAGLENIRRHPFVWSAVLTVAAAGGAVLLWWWERPSGHGRLKRNPVDVLIALRATLECAGGRVDTTRGKLEIVTQGTSRDSKASDALRALDSAGRSFRSVLVHIDEAIRAAERPQQPGRRRTVRVNVANLVHIQDALGEEIANLDAVSIPPGANVRAIATALYIGRTALEACREPLGQVGRTLIDLRTQLSTSDGQDAELLELIKRAHESVDRLLEGNATAIERLRAYQLDLTASDHLPDGG